MLSPRQVWIHLRIFSLFPSLPDLDQALTERGGAMIHDGTWPVVPSPSSFFTLLLPPQLCAASFTSQSLLLYLHPIRSVVLPSLQWVSLHSMTCIRRQLTSQRMRATANRPTLRSTRTLLMRICWSWSRSWTNWARRGLNETWQMPLLQLKRWHYKDGNGMPGLLCCPSCTLSYRPLRLTLFPLPLYQVLRLCTQGSHAIAQVLFNHVLLNWKTVATRPIQTQCFW